MRRILILTASLSLCALIGVDLAGASCAYAHDGATGVVKERMERMKSLGREVKTLARMFKGGEPYHPAMVAASAKRIEGHAGGRMLRLFPVGSNGHPSEAKEDIWRHWPDFEAKADALGTQASALAAVADAGPDAAAATFGRLVGTCKACHQGFKAD